MRNKIWEQVGQFLNRLRCENVTRDTAIEVPGYRETQEEMEGLREKCEATIQQLPQEQRKLLLECFKERRRFISGQRDSFPAFLTVGGKAADVILWLFPVP